jgi:transposase
LPGSLTRSCRLAERESVDVALRQVEFLEAEIDTVERLIAAEALSWPEVKRLMTVPGVNVIVAATFMAALGGAGGRSNVRRTCGDPAVPPGGFEPPTPGLGNLCSIP